MNFENPVVWFEIYVDDLQRAKAFYEKVFQIQLTELPNPIDDDMQMLAFPSNMETNNRASGTLVKMEGFKAGNNSTIVYFMSEDCSIEESRVEDAGGKVFKTKMSIGDYGNMVLATDTEGNMIGIHSMK
ncbi:hypothetical protein SAMN06298216_3797 [Spirosomataceae bacterium TFI 002]|nr:hypothetical protein SAMN06298216_3797 [Spirosomataceae bacterium TFI 002]